LSTAVIQQLGFDFRTEASTRTNLDWKEPKTLVENQRNTDQKET
jgi:hypothetical protein